MRPSISSNSVWQTPHAWTRKRTSSSPGAGCATSARRSGVDAIWIVSKWSSSIALIESSVTCGGIQLPVAPENHRESSQGGFAILGVALPTLSRTSALVSSAMCVHNVARPVNTLIRFSMRGDSYAWSMTVGCGPIPGWTWSTCIDCTTVFPHSTFHTASSTRTVLLNLLPDGMDSLRFRLLIGRTVDDLPVIDAENGSLEMRHMIESVRIDNAEWLEAHFGL